MGAIGRGVLGALVMGLGLGIAAAVGAVGEERLGWTLSTRQWVQALVCSGLVVPVILLLRRRVDRQPLASLGVPGWRAALSTFGLGVLVTLGAAALVLGLGTLLGWVRWSGVAGATLLVFVATTALHIFFFEALPEELALRGYAFQNFNQRMSRWAAALWMTILFLPLPGLANGVQGIVVRALGGSPQPFSFVPAGEDPVTYFSFLAAFSIVLVIARLATGSLWTGIGLHVAFLVVNRLVLSTDPAHTGWSVELTSPSAFLLIPIYLSVAVTGLVLWAEWRGVPLNWLAVDRVKGE